MNSYLHGENFLSPVDEIPKGKRVKTKIIGHSETGHHHVLEGTKFEITEFEKQLYVEVFEDTPLKHNKSFDIHETLTIKPGKYRVTRKQEYDPFGKVMRNVWD